MGVQSIDVAGGVGDGTAAFLLSPRDLLTAVALALGYYASVHLGIALTVGSSPVSILWPSNAVVLAALLLTPRRTWWLMLAAVLPVHLLAQIGLGVPAGMAVCWYLSNMTEAVLGAVMITTLAGPKANFDSIRYLAVFLIAGVLLAPLLSSFLDAGLVALVGWQYTDYWEIWQTRVFSNSLAALMVVPLVVIGVQSAASLRRQSLPRLFEAAVLLSGLCLASAVVFGEFSWIAKFFGHPYVVVPFLIWAAVRYGVGGVSLCSAIIAAFAIAGILNDEGPFGASSPLEGAILVQVFLVVSGSSTMLLAALLVELRQARDLAARRRESLDLALGAAGMGTWEWDIGEQRVTVRSPLERETMGSTMVLSRDELLRLVHESERSTVAGAIDHALQTTSALDVECRILDRSGAYRWVMAKGRVHADAHGKPHRMSGVHADITQHKSQEMEVRAQREQLTHMSRISILGELSGAIAHELKQPLTAILINAQSALRSFSKPPADLEELKAILEDIVHDDIRAGEVIHRLRSLLLRGAVEKRPVSVNECIREVLRLEHADLVARHLRMEVLLADDLPDVAGDPVQLQQVLLNLMINARDAMSDNVRSDGRIRIVSTRDNGRVRVDVSDTGPGIADAEAIFDPFFTTKEHGLGMGLAISRTIVSAHGGDLSAINNERCGATFRMSLPVAVPDTGLPRPGPVPP